MNFAFLFLLSPQSFFGGNSILRDVVLLILIFDGVTVRTGNSYIHHRVGFLRRFGLKTDIHFAHFGLESGMVFEGTTGVYERIYRFNSK